MIIVILKRVNKKRLLISQTITTIKTIKIIILVIYIITTIIIIIEINKKIVNSNLNIFIQN